MNLNRITVAVSSDGLWGEVSPGENGHRPRDEGEALYKGLLERALEKEYPEATVIVKIGSDDQISFTTVKPVPLYLETLALDRYYTDWFRRREAIQATVEEVWEQWVGLV